MNSKYTDLLRNSVIFAMGSFGSKVLQFLIVPLYTFLLTTEEYGQIDIFTTTIALLIPFLTLMIQESIIRFLTVNEITNDEAIGIGLCFFVFASIGSVLAGVVYSQVFGREFAVAFTVCLILNSYIAIFQNYLKACNRTVTYTICGLINTFVFLIGNVFFLVVAKMGIRGYLYSQIIALSCSAIYITVKGKIVRNVVVKRKRNNVILRKMLAFSVPLIPNGLMWWIMNAGDKYIINYYLGDAANGLYSVSIKIATIISTIFGLFAQAWQLSAIKENDDDEKTDFYSKVYVTVMTILLISSAIVMTCTKPIFMHMISADFFEANRYSPLLCVATIMNCLATFTAVTYVVNKNTKGAFVSTLVGAIINVVANFILIQYWNLAGVAIGTLIGYSVVVVIRMINMKRTLQINFDMHRTVIALTILTVYSIAYLWMSYIQDILIGIICTILLFLMYRREVLEVWKGITAKFVR